MSNRMYSERKANIPFWRYCEFNCAYCNFQKFNKISQCQKCRANEKHAHPEVLNKKPPKTRSGEFLTIGLSGDISFASWEELEMASGYCSRWSDRTFLIQSKNPAVLAEHCWAANVIIGTTLESSRVEFPRCEEFPHYNYISAAPDVNKRFDAMYELPNRKAITIEPILDFDLEIFWNAIVDLRPEIAWIGYNSNPKIQLPEPPLKRVQELAKQLREAKIDVREKLMRKAVWEK